MGGMIITVKTCNKNTHKTLAEVHTDTMSEGVKEGGGRSSMHLCMLWPGAGSPKSNFSTDNYKIVSHD